MTHRKSYRKNVQLALELTEYFRTHTVRPVAQYVAEKHITNAEQIDNICRVARICGRNVFKRKGVWYECGEAI